MQKLISASTFRFCAKLARKGELLEMAEGQLRNDDEFAQLERSRNDLFAEPGQVVFVSVADFLDQAMVAGVSGVWMFGSRFGLTRTGGVFCPGDRRCGTLRGRWRGTELRRRDRS
jgi:hypothetical protein